MNSAPLAAPSDAPAATTELSVSYLGYDSDCGWSIEVVRPGQLTDGNTPPAARDLPADVREFLIGWLKDGRIA